jgi:cation-transporting P-type ATPase I
VSLLDPFSRLWNARGRRARRLWSAGGHAHIELRRVDPSQVDRFAERLEAELCSHPAVRWVEIVGKVGRVVVAFDENAAPEEDLVECIEDVEGEFGASDEPFDGRLASHPADREPIIRGAVEIAGSTVGLGIASAQRAARLPPIPHMGTAAGAISFLEHQPRVRRLIELLIGPTPAELTLAVCSGLSQGLAGSTIGPIVDIGLRTTLLAEAAARRRRWLDREGALWDHPSGRRSGAARIEPRPVKLPPGAVERYADAAFLGSLAGAAVTMATTGSLRRGAAMFQAALPKAARFGREGFAAHLGRVLAARGIMPLDSGAIRLLDRVSCLVVDLDLLFRDDFELHDVKVVASADSADPERIARRLFDRQHPTARRRQGGWTLAPLDLLDLQPPPGSKRLAARMARRGLALGLARRGRLVALAGAAPVLRAGAEELVEEARRAGLEVVIAGDPDLASRFRPDRTVPNGHRRPRAIRSLQRAGCVVLAVAGGGSPGLSVADVALGVRRAHEPPPWGADLMSEDDDLGHAHLLVRACGAARQVGRESVVLSGASAGIAMASLAAPFGLASGAEQRVMNVVNLSSAVALANGTRLAARLARQRVTFRREAEPWHELDPSEVLARLGTTPQGLPEEEAGLRRPPEIPPPPLRCCWSGR